MICHILSCYIFGSIRTSRADQVGNELPGPPARYFESLIPDPTRDRSGIIKLKTGPSDRAKIGLGAGSGGREKSDSDGKSPDPSITDLIVIITISLYYITISILISISIKISQKLDLAGKGYIIINIYFAIIWKFWLY
jgi:hypothetical protein